MTHIHLRTESGKRRQPAWNSALCKKRRPDFSFFYAVNDAAIYRRVLSCHPFCRIIMIINLARCPCVSFYCSDFWSHKFSNLNFFQPVLRFVDPTFRIGFRAQGAKRAKAFFIMEYFISFFFSTFEKHYSLGALSYVSVVIEWAKGKVISQWFWILFIRCDIDAVRLNSMHTKSTHIHRCGCVWQNEKKIKKKTSVTSKWMENYS